jgi:hypothetical protein
MSGGVAMKPTDLHPDMSEYSFTLLNAASHQLTVSREYNSNDEDYVVRLKAEVSGWLNSRESGLGEPKRMLVEDTVEVWRFYDREEMDAMIRFLTTVRDDVFPQKEGARGE